MAPSKKGQNCPEISWRRQADGRETRELNSLAGASMASGHAREQAFNPVKSPACAPVVILAEDGPTRSDSRAPDLVSAPELGGNREGAVMTTLRNGTGVRGFL